jgi:hypothetical protein
MSNDNYQPDKTLVIGKCSACNYSPVQVREYERLGYSGRSSGDDRNAAMRFKRLCALCVATGVGETVDIQGTANNPIYENAKVRKQINFVTHTILAVLAEVQRPGEEPPR